MSVIVINHLSLDGVLQGPARPDEDVRDGFPHGGWAESGNDPAMQTAMSTVMGTGFSWLFGRRTYDDLLPHWNSVGGPMADGLNRAPKYVASSRPDTRLPWPSSTLLAGDVPARVAELREQSAGNLVIMGSGELIRSLLHHDLIDQMLLMVHPVVLGSGRRMFGPDAHVRKFGVVTTATTATGVVVATYQADHGVATGA